MPADAGFSFLEVCMFTKPKRPVTRIFVHCSASDNPAHDTASHGSL